MTSRLMCVNGSVQSAACNTTGILTLQTTGLSDGLSVSACGGSVRPARTSVRRAALSEAGNSFP
jgi:hypothetical protein